MALPSLFSFGRGGDADPLVSLRREMDRMFQEMTRGFPAMTAAGFLSPKVNLVETEAGLELTAELPGVKQEDIKLDLTQDVLTLEASTASEKEEKDEKRQYHLIERSSGTFLRRFVLPFEPEPDKVTASFESGVLKVVLPRPAQAKKTSNRIPIQGG
ncbi:MAG: Hsp20/alpha crystallin family protein [Rhodovarius sp.]|nr:Hsp20/alpha crystallin family protein [Rhodovarius sp.]MCX7930967.1 Hsp20/alpha crystallin family protein [Rhodovarius sp.]MDW8315289.1 Hsp20/alpha crystallin family protein [Rhodovarius sp.]